MVHLPVEHGTPPRGAWTYTPWSMDVHPVEHGRQRGHAGHGRQRGHAGHGRQRGHAGCQRGHAGCQRGHAGCLRFQLVFPRIRQLPLFLVNYAKSSKKVHGVAHNVGVPWL